MTHTDQIARQMIRELKNVRYNGQQSETLQDRSELWLWQNLDRIITALQVASASEDVRPLDQQIHEDFFLPVLNNALTHLPQPPADVSEDELVEIRREPTERDLQEIVYHFNRKWFNPGGSNSKTIDINQAKQICKSLVCYSALTRAKSDERVVSVEDAKAALTEMDVLKRNKGNNKYGQFMDFYYDHEIAIRALLQQASER